MKQVERAFLSLVLASLAHAFSPGHAAAAKRPQTAEPKPDAVLAMAAGPVTVTRAGGRVPAAFGTQLIAGDVVETGPGAQAGILFDSGQILEIGPGSRIAIGSLPAKSAGAGGDTVAHVPEALGSQLARFSPTASSQGGLSALPALRSAEAHQLEILGPRRSLVLPGRPTFSWMPVDGALEYRVRLEGLGAANGDHRSVEPRWQVPESAPLRPGEQWTWSVEAMTPEGPVRSDTQIFEVAPDSVVRAVASLHERLDPLLASGNDPRADVARYLLGNYYRSQGLFCQAVEHLQALVTRHPDRAELHRQLGSVYQTIGRYEKAAEEYRRALEE